MIALVDMGIQGAKKATWPQLSLVSGSFSQETPISLEHPPSQVALHFFFLRPHRRASSHPVTARLGWPRGQAPHGSARVGQVFSEMKSIFWKSVEYRGMLQNGVVEMV